MLVFGDKAPVNGRRIRFPLLYPEEGPFAITKSPQIRMTVFALVRHEEFNVKWLQRRLIEGERAFDVADGQNNVVEHRGKGGGQVLTTRASSKLSSGRNYGLGPDPVSSSSSFQLIFIWLARSRTGSACALPK